MKYRTRKLSELNNGTEENQIGYEFDDFIDSIFNYKIFDKLLTLNNLIGRFDFNQLMFIFNN